jgi:hypothetical protein
LGIGNALAAVALAALQTGQLAAQPPIVTLTQIGSPTWRPADFQLFSAPAVPDEAFEATVGALEPLHPPAAATTYTTPHGPPYDTELSTNAAAAGFVSRSVFPREAIMANPNGIFFGFMLLPDPGITGSSRDFATGPVIPNSLFPMAETAQTWKNGTLIFDHGDAVIEVRPTDQPYDGSSHRVRGSSYWNRSANTLGNWEFRWTLRDTQDNGWDIVAPYKIVAELPLPGDFNEDGAVDAADYVLWRDIDNTPDAYAAWRANFGTSLFGSSSSMTPSAASLPAVPEPAAIVTACIALIGINTAMCRITRPT